MKILLTLGSVTMISNAFLTVSGVAPLQKKQLALDREKFVIKTYPPTSKKLAGLPPWRDRTSMVAMARPAPLTRHPTLPSNLMKLRLAFWASTSDGSS